MHSVDNSAPRYRIPRHNSFNNEFMNSLPEHLKQLGNKKCRKLISEFGALINETSREFRDGAELPLRLGVIFIGTCPRKKKHNPDWLLSVENDKLINHQNWESDQKTAKIFYTNSHIDGKPSFANGQFWAFKAAQRERKKLKHVYREHWTRYAEVQPWDKISQKFRKDNFKMKMRGQKTDYNPYE